MLKVSEIRRLVEKGWASKYEVMVEKDLADIIYGAMTASSQAVEEFLRNRLGEREVPYSHRGSSS